MKRVFSVLLSACLLFGLISGCSPDKSGSGGSDSGNSSTSPGVVPMGRYVEEQGETLENLLRTYDFKNTDDGGFTFFGRVVLNDATQESTYNRYTVPAGSGPITTKEIDGLVAFAPNGVRDISEGKDGSLYILYTDENLQTRAARSKDGGPFEPIEVADMVAPSGSAPNGTIDIGGVNGSVKVGNSSTGDPGSASGDTGDGGTSGGFSFNGASVSIGGEVDAGGADTDTDAGASDAGLDVVTDTPKSGSFSFGEGDLPSKSASGIRALDDGGFLILYGDKGASRYASDGTLQGEYPGNAFAFVTAVSGNTLIIGSSDGSALWSYDLSTGKQDGTYTYENMGPMGMNVKISLDADDLYLADSTGVYRQAKGSTIWEKLVDGDLTSLVMPNLSISGFAPDGSGGSAVLLEGKDTFQFMRYVYAADVPTNPDTELTIFSLHENNTIRQAIGEFQRHNSNVRVNFRVGLDDSGSATTEDVIRALNTELLAGKGPDLILLDGLNIDSYVDKGVLLDLTDFVAGQDGLLANLTKAYEKDGKLYGVPSRFTFPAMMGKSADVDSIDSLQSLVERVKQDQGGTPPFLRASDKLWNENGVGMMMDYYDACVQSWFKDGAIDHSALTAFFTAMQEMEKVMKQYTPQSNSMAFISVTATGSSGGFEEINMGPTDLKDGKALFHIQEMAGLFALTEVSQKLGNMEGQKLSTLFGGGAYTPKGGVGINAAGKQQELAKSFLEMLLSPTVQDNYLYDGYPVNGNSLDKLVKNTLDDKNTISVSGSASSGGQNGEDMKTDMGFLDMCRTLDTPLLADAVIRDAVEAQMSGLMDGSITPEQAAANVAEKTLLYLAE